MTCSVTIVEHPTHLHVTVTGDNTPETLRTYTTEITQYCVRVQKMRVLVVVQLTGPELSMLDVYKGVAAGSDNASGLGMRIAYVDANLEHSVDSMLLAEGVARGRGIPVQTFRDVEDAQFWLLSEGSL